MPLSFLSFKIYTTLEKCIAASKDKQFKLLKDQHDSQVSGATKLIQSQVSREFKTLHKRHKDKDELDRYFWFFACICLVFLVLINLVIRFTE